MQPTLQFLHAGWLLRANFPQLPLETACVLKIILPVITPQSTLWLSVTKTIDLCVELVSTHDHIQHR